MVQLIFHNLRNQVQKQLVLVAEMGVDRGLLDADISGNLVHGGGIEALNSKARQRGILQFFSRGFAHSPTALSQRPMIRAAFAARSNCLFYNPQLTD